MTVSRKFFVLGVISLGAMALLADQALACVRCGAANPGRGCGQLVTLKHPDLKGKARKAEWDRCMANPDGYGG
jgi:hypothetical protein